MSERGMKQLHSLLFGGDEELVNVKFFPGNNRSMTRDQLAGTGAEMIQEARDAWSQGKQSNPPKTNMEKAQLMG